MLTPTPALCGGHTVWTRTPSGETTTWTWLGLRTTRPSSDPVGTGNQSAGREAPGNGRLPQECESACGVLGACSTLAVALRPGVPGPAAKGSRSKVRCPGPAEAPTVCVLCLQGPRRHRPSRSTRARPLTPRAGPAPRTPTHTPRTTAGPRCWLTTPYWPRSPPAGPWMCSPG